MVRVRQSKKQLKIGTYNEKAWTTLAMCSVTSFDYNITPLAPNCFPNSVFTEGKLSIPSVWKGQRWDRPHRGRWEILAKDTKANPAILKNSKESLFSIESKLVTAFKVFSERTICRTSEDPGFKLILVVFGLEGPIVLQAWCLDHYVILSGSCKSKWEMWVIYNI